MVTYILIAKLVCDECVRVIGVTEVLHLNLEVAGPTRCEGNNAVVGAVIIIADEVVVLVINIKVEVGVSVAAKNDGGIFTALETHGIDIGKSSIHNIHVICFASNASTYIVQSFD